MENKVEDYRLSKLRKMELFCQWGGLQEEEDEGKGVKTG